MEQMVDRLLQEAIYPWDPFYTKEFRARTRFSEDVPHKFLEIRFNDAISISVFSAFHGVVLDKMVQICAQSGIDYMGLSLEGSVDIGEHNEHGLAVFCWCDETSFRIARERDERFPFRDFKGPAVALLNTYIEAYRPYCKWE